MGWSAIVYGDLRMSVEKEAAWRKLTVDPADWHDWPEDLYVEMLGRLKVGKLLTALQDYAEDAWIHFQRSAEDVLRVNGLLHEDAYRDFGGALAVAFRAASKLGVEGDVYLADFQMSDFVWRLRLTRKGSTIGRPRRDVVDKVFPKALARIGLETDRIRRT
jgi:hypothetical protein